MEKKTYYISVGPGVIVPEDKGATAFEFEIQATEEDVEKLEELFQDMNAEDTFQFIEGHFPQSGYTEKHIPYNEFDDRLQAVYRKIYELGTQETKHHIESMNIL